MIKKNVVGIVKVLRLFDGENRVVSKDLNVKIVEFYLLGTAPNRKSKIVLSGSKNGY
jgi:hypothetical protein